MRCNWSMPKITEMVLRNTCHELQQILNNTRKKYLRPIARTITIQKPGQECEEANEWGNQGPGTWVVGSRLGSDGSGQLTECQQAQVKKGKWHCEWCSSKKRRNWPKEKVWKQGSQRNWEDNREESSLDKSWTENEDAKAVEESFCQDSEKNSGHWPRSSCKGGTREDFPHWWNES